MLSKVLPVLLGILLILQSRVEGPQTESKNEASAHDVVYGPPPQPLENKLFSEETKSTKTETGRRAGKLPEASRILNTILSNYDHKLRPGIGEKPTVVTVEISVNSLGPLSILDMEYTIDIIFSQTWYDERLCYNDTFESLVLNGNVVSQLWIPDTFFRNSKRTHEHEITMPNQMVRIYKDGKVLYTIRMTIDAGCSLHMLRFPMDSHSCPLSFSSFSYPENEMIYKWENFKLEINEKNSWKLFQFDFTGVSNKTEIITTPVGDFMVMTIFFNVSRRFGYVAFQNYVPSSVTTMLSWVSFWIKTESAPARTSLGITSVLTMTTLGTFSRKNFPRVSYITALDFYIAICFVFCFCALLEFAVLNFLIYNQTKAHASPKLRHPRIDSRAHARTRARSRACARQHQEAFVCQIVTTEGSDGEDRPSCSAQQPPSPGSPEGPHSVCSKLACCERCKGFKKYFCMVPDCEGSTWQQGHLCIHVYRLDNYSRVVFPVTFFFFNVLYWLVCLNL
ncbi:PREDICTED: gamma-aminobutyric acid receptor subunit epsilon [Mandrillus leucophaeus]|uniref:Gamma-aminobutyric acid receptor subunit epsilon n=1 Tax=Mandrillus leucophaeus TaxID=9568 RepID=A0A2K5YWE7_MANLE|nr:PREDICTED: gamma-aminobutyric acid receptor subunit epsilon [Mandrillus leucophaeus]